ncbi:O-antigen ligase family protein [Aggregatibacter kilianii]|uniref:O-antigen ligase family protein n=1 Tax=Aggregatibacter kilianii TaxID=2025884 RepID=UPI000D64114D|nr:O-antigen ligase [Aggregatibacter kilianii]
MGVGFFIYRLIRKPNDNPGDTGSDSVFIAALLFYVTLFSLSILYHHGKIREFDNPSRILFFLTLLPLFARYPIRFHWLLHAIPWGSLIAGITAIIHRFVLHYEMAFMYQMHIQSGDIAMSLGMFSLAVTFYFFIRRQYRVGALYFAFSLMGVFASLLSTARGGWIGVPFVISLILFAYHRALSKKFFGGFFILLALIATTVAMLPNTKIKERIAAAEYDITAYFQKNNGSTSVGARFDMWKSAMLMAQEKPIFGWGVQGVTEKRKQQYEQGLISQYAASFNHAHNQYFDDLSKRGILGLLALLGVFFVPLRFFMRHLKSTDAELKLASLLGAVHIVSVMFYCFSQGFFSHNSGNIFYFFPVIVFYALVKQLNAEAENNRHA